MSQELLGAISTYLESNKDSQDKDLLEALGGVAEKLKPSEKTSPGRLAAKLAASKEAPASEPAKEVPADKGSDKPEAGAPPKTFAEAKAAALELVGR